MNKKMEQQKQIVAEIEILKSKIARMCEIQSTLSKSDSKKDFQRFVENSEKVFKLNKKLDSLQRKLLVSHGLVVESEATKTASVMEAEVASEGRAAAKKPLKKTDKRKSPAFIAHLRALAEARRKKPVDQPKAKPAKAKVVATKKPVVKGKVVAKKSA